MYCEYTLHHLMRQAHQRVREREELLQVGQQQRIALTNTKLHVARNVVNPPIKDDPSLMQWYIIIKMASAYMISARGCSTAVSIKK